jgi:hypothetical protein
MNIAFLNLLISPCKSTNVRGNKTTEMPLGTDDSNNPGDIKR